MSYQNKTAYFSESAYKKTNDLYAHKISGLLKAHQKAEQNRFLCFNDGQIIGTGESDFTKGNIAYDFILQGNSFQLLDVPGIEGNESAYAEYVEEAVTKAHLVLYVNGTNKKPEAATAEKIKQYMRRDASVFAVCNVRGKADSYEFTEDQDSIERTHKGSKDAMLETRDVLSSAIGENRLLGSDSVQGLLSFCSLALNEEGVSTIHRSREKDLIKAQTSFVRDFGDVEKMKEFSRINSLSELIKTKAETFDEDIIESNKRKVMRLVEETLLELSEALKEYEDIHKPIKTEIALCKEKIQKNLENKKASIRKRSKHALDTFFSNIEEGIHEIIEKQQKDSDMISGLSEKLVREEENQFVSWVEAIREEEINEYNSNMESILKRLHENVSRIHWQHQMRKQLMNGVPLSEVEKSLKLKKKDYMILAFGVGIYAKTGSEIGKMVGAFFDPALGVALGAAIGAAIGAIIGLIINIKTIFSDKDKRIRMAQDESSKIIEEQKSAVFKEFNKDTDNLIESMQQRTEEDIAKLDEDESKMNDVKIILESKITAVMSIKMGLEGKPYGSI